MLDRDIRIALREQYLQRYYQDSNAKVVEELTLFANRARIDIAVINGNLLGYEIKSDRDTITRLPDQMSVYGQIFDYVTVISSPKHTDKLSNYLPNYCGLVVYEPTINGINLSTIIKPTQSTEQSGFMLASLLWHEEAYLLLKEAGLGKGARKKRIRHLWQDLAENFTVEELGQKIRTILKCRKAWKVPQVQE